MMTVLFMMLENCLIFPLTQQINRWYSKVHKLMYVLIGITKGYVISENRNWRGLFLFQFNKKVYEEDII